MIESFQKSRKNIQLYSQTFRSIFGFELKRYYGNNALEMMMGFDIIKFEDDLASKDSEYNAEECSYKNKNVSLEDYIKIKFGEEANSLITTLSD